MLSLKELERKQQEASAELRKAIKESQEEKSWTTLWAEEKGRKNVARRPVLREKTTRKLEEIYLHLTADRDDIIELLTTVSNIQAILLEVIVQSGFTDFFQSALKDAIRHEGNAPATELSKYIYRTLK